MYVIIMDLAIAKKTINRRSVLSILQAVQFKDGKMVSTDMEDYYIAPGIQKDLDICVDLSDLNKVMESIKGYDYKVKQVVGEYETPTLNIEVEDGTVFNIKGEPSSDYVAMPNFTASKWGFTIDIEDLYYGIYSTYFAITDRNFSPVLTGMLLRIQDNTFYCVGTDSFRLMEYKKELDGTYLPVDIILRKKTCRILMDIMDKYRKNRDSDVNLVHIEMQDTMVRITIGEDILYALILQGSYPNYNTENIIPTKFNYEAEYDVKALLEQLKRHEVITGDINNYVEWNGGEIVSQGDVGDCITKVQHIPDGEPIEFGVNASYVTGALKMRFKDKYDIVKLSMVNGEKPIVFTLAPNLTYVVRPLIK